MCIRDSIYLTFDNFFSMNAFEPVFWMAGAAIVLRILNGGDRRLWLLFGVLAGLGLQNKHSMLFFGSGLFVGLLLAPARREFTRIWIWLGAGVAFLIFLPNLLWEIHDGWPTIALLHAVVGTKYSTVSPLEYILQQALLTDPLSAPIWLAGIWFLLRDRVGKKYSVLAWAYLIVLAEMIYLHGKIYYLAPAYIMLFAAGAVWLELRLIPRTGRWLVPSIATPATCSAGPKDVYKRQVQINYERSYLSQEYNDKFKANAGDISRLEEKFKKECADDGECILKAQTKFVQQLVADGKLPHVSWEKIVDHLDHFVKLVGPDHVGLGSDFDGADMPEGMEDASKLPKITEALVRKGYSDADIRKILGGNTLRVMEQAEQVSRELNSRQ